MTSYKFLVADPDEVRRNLIQIELNGMFPESTFVEGENAEKTLEELKKDPNISCIICNWLLGKDNATKVIKFLNSFKLPTPILLVSEENLQNQVGQHKCLDEFLKEAPGRAYLPRPFNNAQLINKINSLVSIDINMDEYRYRPISTSRFKFIQRFPIDLYIKKISGNYIQISKSEDGYIDQLGEKYSAKGLKEFYTTTSEYIRLIDFIDALLLKKMSDKEAPVNEQVNCQFESVAQISESLRNIGMKDTALQLAAVCTDSCIRTIESSAKLSNVLGQIIKKNNYQYQLSLLTSYVAICVASEIDWITKQAKEKLAMAAILQDLSLNDDSLCRINSTQSDLFQSLEETQKELVLTHPERSYMMAHEIDPVSTDLKNLILQHHERPNKMGFPKQLDEKTTAPLSCIFILANEFAQRLLKKPLTQEDLRAAVDYFEANFDRGNYKKAFEAFKKSFKKNLN